MNRRLRLTFVFLLILSLMANALTGLTASEAPAEADAHQSVVRVPVRAMFAADPVFAAELARLPKGSGPIKSISSTSSVSPRRFSAFTINVKVSPATQAAADDLFQLFDASKLTLQSKTASFSKSSITFSFTFVAAGAPGGTSVKFYSNAKKWLYSQSR